MANILQVYEQCINDPQVLQHGDAFLSEHMRNTPAFCQESLKLVFDPALHFRKFVCILFKNVLLLNWQSIADKRQLIEATLVGLMQEQNPQMQELVSILLCELTRREECFQIVQIILVRVEQAPHLLDTLIYLFMNLDDRLNAYAEDVLKFLIARAHPNTYQLLYYTVRSFSFCEQTDAALLRKCFDSTFMLWMERFQQVLQSPNVSDQVYVVKTLNLIFKDLREYSKQIRKPIAAFIVQYLRALASAEYSFEDLSFFDEYADLDHNYEVLVFFTLQLLLSLNQQQLCSQEIYLSLFQLLNKPYANSAPIQYHCSDDDPTVKKSILLFLEQQLSNNKTKSKAKEFILAYLNQSGDCEAKYVLLENFLADLIDASQYFALIDLIVSNRVTVRTLSVASTIYTHTQGDTQNAYFTNLFALNQQQLQGEEGIVCLFNIGKLCSHLAKRSVTLNVHLSLALPKYDEETAHTFFDSMLQIIKVFPSNDFNLLPVVFHQWHASPHDTLVCQIMVEIVEQLAQSQWEAVYELFKTGHPDIVLKVASILAKRHPEKMTDQIVPIAQKLLSLQNYEQSCQLTMLLKTLLWHSMLDQQSLQIVLAVVETQLKLYSEPEYEAATEHVHDLLLIVWSKYLNRQSNALLLNQIKLKIIHQQTPSTIQGLLTLLSAMFIQDPTTVMGVLSDAETVQSMFIKWLRFARIFKGQNQGRLQFICLYQLSFLPQLDGINYVDPFTGKVSPVKQELLAYLAHYRNQTEMQPKEDDEDFYDVEDQQETEFEQDVGCLRDLMVEIPNFTLEHLRAQSQSTLKNINNQ